ncbi:undecaprenyl-diphosphate phosphatase [Blautia sp. MSJ-19]|uniref:undecaprenyl-diphosphate phosphatase n=1 Tax=Blautia sp. MSJ-19 TaxID=2841517 RepID=UPI001C0ED875|nr:undecaprenyl-diphosphate phosphatase [Blautia sp. MSJ-19]MBU5481531.1 undecaprenyl-diphosphate phosphatase [Blautia sp. MSJ-19]
MTVLFVILLAIVQGITEFLPVSSFGHLCFVQNILGMEHGAGVLLEAMLHVGTLAAIFMTFQKDIRRLALETLEMFMDLIGNISLYIHNKRTGAHLHYAKLICNIYRKFAVLLMLSMIPTMFLGYTARRLVEMASVSKLIPVAGILITGILLLVVDLSQLGGTKAAKDASFSNAMWIGICQGLSVFPGLSRSGMTISAGLMSGFSRTFAVKYSYILSIPAIIGALCMELGQFGSADMTVGLGFTYVLGMSVAALAGSLVIRSCLKLVHKGKLRYFAYYCFAAGIVSLIVNYTM